MRAAHFPQKTNKGTRYRPFAYECVKLKVHVIPTTCWKGFRIHTILVFFWFWLNYIYQFITEMVKSVTVQSFKRLLKNGFLYFYATFIVLLSHFFISKFSVQVLSQANVIYNFRKERPLESTERWGGEPPPTSPTCLSPHTASSLFSAKATVESSASPLLPSRPSSGCLPSQSQARMRALGWYSCKPGRSCQDRRRVTLPRARNTGWGNSSILGPDNPNYLKKISLAGKNQPFS